MIADQKSSREPPIVQSLSITDAETLVLKTLKQVMEEKLDSKNVRLASVTKERGFRIYTEDEMAEVVARLPANGKPPSAPSAPTMGRGWIGTEQQEDGENREVAVNPRERSPTFPPGNGCRSYEPPNV